MIEAPVEAKTLALETDDVIDILLNPVSLKILFKGDFLSATSWIGSTMG